MQKITLIYDGECPVCAGFSSWVRIRETVGELSLLDARTGPEIMQEITARGWDIDQGMVLKVGDELYHGADAMHVLSRLSSRSGIFNRLNFWLFRSRRFSQLIYPVLRALRNLLLKVLGKSGINDSRL